ncbi:MULTISPECIES: hypothetical protein [unclassified Blastococcus]
MRPASPELYRAHGLTIRSDYPLPMLPAPGTAPPDLVVVRGEDRTVPDADEAGSTRLAETRDPGGRVFSSFTRTPGGVDLRWPGICRMRADQQVRRVLVDHEPGVDDDLVAVLVAGAVVSVHLLLHGRLVLHASAVEVQGAAVAFVGGAGAGKSTVAALFGRAGHPLVTDDVLRVDPRGRGGAVAHRGGLGLRLRERAASLAEGVRAATTGDGRIAVGLPVTAAATLPLRACLVPRPMHRGGGVALEPLPAVGRMLALLRCPRVVGWSDGPTSARQFALAGDLAEIVPVAAVDLPWGPPFDPTVPARVVEALEAL